MNWTNLLRKTLPLAGCAAIALSAGTAMAECPRDIDRVRQDLLGDSGFQERYTRGGVDKHDYRALLGAARMFSDMGLEERCQNVLAGVRELAQKAESGSVQDRAQREAQRRGDRFHSEREREQAQRIDRERERAQRTGREREQVERTDRERERAQRTDREREQMQSRDRDQRKTRRDRDSATRADSQPEWVASARPLTSTNLSGNLLIGADVRNARNQAIGKLDDFVLRNNSIRSIIVVADGAHYRVPADQAKVALRGEDRTAVIVIDMTQEKLRAQPRVEQRNDRWARVGTDQRQDRQRTRRDDRQARADDRRDEASREETLKRPEGAWVSITGKVKAATDEALVIEYAKGKGHIVVEMNGLGRYTRMHDTMAGHRVTVTGVIEKTDLNARRIQAGTVYDHNNSTYFVGEAGDNYYYYYHNYNRRPYGYYGYWGPTYMAPSYRTPRGAADDSETETTFTIHGQITQAGSDEFVVQSGVGELQVDVDEMADNPLDNEGRPQLKVGDHVSVTGTLDDEDLFDRREMIATHVTLRARAGQPESEEKKEERMQ